MDKTHFDLLKVDQNSTTELLSDPYESILETIRFYKVNRELAAQVDGWFLVVFQSTSGTVLLGALNETQYLLAVFFVYTVAAIVVGTVIGLLIRLLKTLYRKSRLESVLKKLKKLRAGADELFQAIVKNYFPDDDLIVYQLNLKKSIIKRLLRKIIQSGAYGLIAFSGVNSPIIWVNHQILSLFLINDLGSWDVYLKAISSNPQFIRIMSVATETNIRTKASVNFSAFIWAVKTAQLIIQLCLNASMPFSAVLKILGVNLLYGGGAYMLGQLAPLRLVLYFLIGTGTFTKVSTEKLKIEACSPATISTSEFEKQLVRFANDESDLDQSVHLWSGNQKAFDAIHNHNQEVCVSDATLQNLADDETRKSIRTRGLERLRQTKIFIKNRFKSVSDYDSSNDDNKFYESYGLEMFD